jgi:hypothetical protein
VDAVDRLSADPARAQRAAWAAALCAGLRAVGADADADPDRDAVVCLDAFAPDCFLPLRRHAAAGVRVLVTAPTDDVDAMLGRLRAIGPGALVYQYAVEATLIAGDTLDEEDAPYAALELTERAEPPYATALLYAVNVPDGAWSAALAAPRLSATATPVPRRRLAGLEAANRELWAANAALGRQLREMREQLGAGRPALSAGRLGGVPAASALGALARETDAFREQADARERELWDSIAALQSELAERTAALSDAVAARDAAIRRHDVLKSRKAVRLALGLAGLRPRRR